MASASSASPPAWLGPMPPASWLSAAPKSWYGTWGSTLTAFSGVTALWNHPNQPRPIGAPGVYPDYVSAAMVPAAIIAALLRRRITGKGAVLELAQVEATAYMLGVSLL